MDAFDIQVVDDDMVIQNGDLLVDKSDQQHIEHILKANPGHFYKDPLIGIGILKYQNATVTPGIIEQRIRLHLKSDNYRVKFLKVRQQSGGPMQTFIDAERIK